MIEEYIKIHDKFSFELKVGFIAQETLKSNDFTVNLWMFIPESLHVNKSTYAKESFYRDLKANVRLITPIYPLNEIANKEGFPLHALKGCFSKLDKDWSSSTLTEFETHIKMFQSIVKSSMRDQFLLIKDTEEVALRRALLAEFLEHTQEIITEYRKLESKLSTKPLASKALEYYLFGDEFMSNTVELQAFRLLKLLRSIGKNKEYEQARLGLISLINQEGTHRAGKGYPQIKKKDPERNHLIVSRYSYFKKYMESHLFLKAKTKEDGTLVRQFFYSVAAGFSMIVATIIAFSFQLKYGNFTLPLFIALVIGYMLKDRIKELSRFYFSHKMESKYFDNKTEMSFNDNLIGLYKESQSFVKEEQVPAEVIQLRNRTALMEADNQINAEKIILFRLMMKLYGEGLEQSNVYPISGVNYFLQFNLTDFARMMDNPHVPLYIADPEADYKIIDGEKIYYINLLLRYKYKEEIELKRYRISFNREGIQKLERF